MIDVIIVSFARNKKLRDMTQGAVNSCVGDGVNVIVVEQNNDVMYKKAKTLHYGFKFNYHRCLNLGLRECRNEYVALCNNDLIFSKGWFEGLKRVLEMGYDTVCPYCVRAHKEKGYERGNYLYEGFRVGFEFIGWCIVGRRKLIEEVGLNENIEFWYSDNYLAEVLKLMGKKHALVCNSFVEHIYSGSMTLKGMPRGVKVELTNRQKRKFDIEKKKLYLKR